MAWDPGIYLDFAGLRGRPALDLLARVHLDANEVARVVDLGCGSANLVPLLRHRFPEAHVTAVDNDPAMLAAARRATAGDDRVEVVDADLASWMPGAPLDLLFSNAALHWADDHDALLPRLLGHLRPGGVLAVQVPRNHDAASHRTLAAVASQGPWAPTLVPLLREHPVAEPEHLHRLLGPHTDHLDLWTTTYLQHLAATPEGIHPVAHWMRGSTLRPLLAALEPAVAESFWTEFHAAIAAVHAPEPDGAVLFAFTRLFLVAVT